MDCKFCMHHFVQQILQDPICELLTQASRGTGRLITYQELIHKRPPDLQLSEPRGAARSREKDGQTHPMIVADWEDWQDCPTNVEANLEAIVQVRTHYVYHQAACFCIHNG